MVDVDGRPCLPQDLAAPGVEQVVAEEQLVVARGAQDAGQQLPGLDVRPVAAVEEQTKLPVEREMPSFIAS